MNMDLSALNLPPNPTVIDCGCNEGQWISHVKPQLTGKPRIVAIDMLHVEAMQCQMNHPDVLVLTAALVDYQTELLAARRHECSQCSSILKETSKLDQLCGHQHQPVATVVARRHECSQSSSILAMTELHDQIWGSPTHVPVAVEHVIAMPLDSILALAMVDHVDLLKLDLQGYELHALNGGLQTLAMTNHVISEVSWVSLYEDQVLFAELDKFMESQGFVFECLFDVRRMPGESEKPACGDAWWRRK